MELVMLICAMVAGEPDCERVNHDMEHPALCNSYGKLRVALEEKKGNTAVFTCTKKVDA